ncbi:hypothetical protein A2960_05670 [Candidatus Gottesmanbacteria bacterium RIFCSPLOWO2_01_FULL_39_12b]|uniref:BrnT family toxin n=1 Tax=Candidatus Gottesmanbacteria bacterium RIFCSPLOWO2_01_FULL_39_12b TaxID=1798388 RepID=A0A1F6AMU6_9BACT|nr:MAG: hypothetical protein A2960_05670 [Candidatus Gottesmanbacteria bacterium RIFCSPLOWO2_01_FULL_39_12b]
MTRIVIKKLIFDAYNLEHIRKHNVSEMEVIEAGKRIIFHKKSYKSRYLAVGRVNRRLIALAIRRVNTGEYYLVTARDAGKNERRRVYEKEKKQNS